jgi:ATP-dependent DNA ligase
MLPIRPPFAPMEARSVETIPRGKEWQYEPKWDGFRCLVFRDGRSIELQSKSGRPFRRYFPELVEAVAQLKPSSFVFDGEIVVPEGRGFSFDSLLQRIHPAESRIKKLAAETPALLIVFDLLVDERGHEIHKLPLAERRPKLERFAKQYLADAERFRLSPITTDRAKAESWLKGGAGALDGVIAKRRDFTYRSGEREGMQKIKNLRTVDCVVGGFRYGTRSEHVASLLLGLYDNDGKLNHVGFTATIAKETRPALTEKLEKLISPPGFTGDAPGGPSRWSTERSAEWKPLKPTLVVEVCYDHFSGGRFRHGTKLMRWRPDKAPRQCTYDQILAKRSSPLKLLERARKKVTIKKALSRRNKLPHGRA